jgi:dUTPase
MLDYYFQDRQLVIIPYPTIELEEVSELSETHRGDGSFGSSGK